MKVILTVLSVFLIIFFIVWGFHGFATKDSGNYSPPEKKEQPKGANEKVFPNGTRGITSLIDSDTVKKRLISVEPTEFISFSSISDSKLPEDIKNELRQKSNNLKTYGSFSKGEITHEFVNTNYYKDRLVELGGIDKINEKLSFQPSNLNSVLSEYNLIGADYSGTYEEGAGYNSIFKSYSNNNSSIEINELFLKKGSDKLNFFEENINTFVNDSPATFEKVGSDIYNVSWLSNDRLFAFSTKGLKEGEVMRIAQGIASSAQK